MSSTADGMGPMPWVRFMASAWSLDVQEELNISVSTTRTFNPKSSIYRVYIESSFPSIMSLFDSCAAVAADGRWMAR